MKRACIAIVDATRARLYTYEQDAPDDPAHELREVLDLAHRAHEDTDVKFAKDIVAEVDRVVRTGDYGHVIVVASPKMLGDLRKCDAVLYRDGVIVDEIPRDLAKLTSPQLHDHLAQLKLLPPRQRLKQRWQGSC